RPGVAFFIVCGFGRDGLGGEGMLRVWSNERLHFCRGYLGHGLVVSRTRARDPTIATLFIGLDCPRAYDRNWNSWEQRLDAMAKLLRRTSPNEYGRRPMGSHFKDIWFRLAVYCRGSMGWFGSVHAGLVQF